MADVNRRHSAREIMKHLSRGRVAPMGHHVHQGNAACAEPTLGASQTIGADAGGEQLRVEVGLAEPTGKRKTGENRPVPVALGTVWSLA